MNYLDVYWARINHLGENTAERIRNRNIRSFQKRLDESPHTVKDLSVERGLYFEGIVLSNKDKEHEKIMFLEVANDIPLLIGDIMNWPLETGETEKWILVQEEKKVNGSFRTFWIVRCNYLIKWVDENGHLQQSWCHFVSSLDSKVKGNFRTWHNLISPQPNKYAEMLLPRYHITRSTNFIVEQESWNMVEYDYTSVPGIMYLSLTENKINLIYDDVNNNIADTDKLAVYRIETAKEIQSFNIGDEIIPTFTLMKNGEPIELKTTLITNDKKVARLVNGKLMAVGKGEVDITVQLVDFPNITSSIKIQVNEEEKISLAYIEGKDNIRLDRESVYELRSTQEMEGEAIFSLEETNLAKIIMQSGFTCKIKANDANKLGKIVLHASYNGKEYIKTISIIPIW